MPDEKLELLREIERQVLWISTNIIHHANHERASVDGLKVGGHQASSASIVSLMTALYLHHLRGDDFVAVKPHGSPVLRARNYVMGNLDVQHLDGLRRLGSLQAYPSRTKDPDRVDFSTGSVGLGPAATLFAATVRDYVDAHFGQRPPSRFFAVVGDAELDEGNVWEAVHDPASTALGSVTWLIDFNRQSLDRVVPDMRISPWQGAFASHGWQVIQVKYGRRLASFVEENDGESLLYWIDEMPNERYQSLFSLEPGELRQRFLEGAPADVVSLLGDLDDERVSELVTDLGGHDLSCILEALEQADQDSRPTAIFAYTHKGWGLPIQGHARNHAAVLSPQQVGQLRRRLEIDDGEEWPRFPAGSAAGRLLAQRGEELRGTSIPSDVSSPRAPGSTRPRTQRATSTQEAFGRIVTDLSRDESLRPYLVTTSPDVATSTNLAGWINRSGVFAHHERATWSDDPTLKWLESPAGQHIELGISEMNFFLLLGQLGLARSFSGQRLIPIGTLYDPFVARGLDALIYGLYSGASFVFAGTPSGITLAPEGGAHQSTVTPSIGMELPGLDFHEPAFVQALDWLVCDAVNLVAASDDQHAQSSYFRLTTRQLSQESFSRVIERLGASEARRQVLQGSYQLEHFDFGGDSPQVTLATCGAVVPEVLEAARELHEEGISVRVMDMPSPGRLYRAWRDAASAGISTARRKQLPEGLARFGSSPVVTVQDGASHGLAWLGGALGVRSASLGVDGFGQSGTIPDLYQLHQLDSGSIVNAACSLLDL